MTGLPEPPCAAAVLALRELLALLDAYLFLPGFLALAHAVLERALLHYGLYGLDEDNSWGFGWNLLVFLAALAQQVVLSSSSAKNTTCIM